MSSEPLLPQAVVLEFSGGAPQALARTLTEVACRALEVRLPKITPAAAHEAGVEVSTEPLLHQVAVARFSGGANQQVADIATDAIHRALEVRQTKTQGPAALKAKRAAQHLGVSRSHFYQLLKREPDLAKLAFKAGRCRLWPVTSLDAYMRSKQGT
jgi:hypothetical protein